MLVFEWVIGLLAGSLLLSGLARRLTIPYPTLLAVGGALLALWPALPRFQLDPHVALALFVAPVLLDAAFDSSVRDIKDNWAPITGLVFGAVGLTVVGVAVVAHAMVPSLPWAAAAALGAIVAPPDAAAATAVLRQLRPPHRILTILEGESLLNDATALVIYRIAVGVAVGTSDSVGPILMHSTIGTLASLLAGPAFAWLSMRIVSRISDPPTSILTQFCSTFAVWIIAERLELSAVLTIVSYAIVLARSSYYRMPARLRIPAFAVWDTVVYLLNVLAFVLVGLQLGPILERLDAHYLLVAGAVLATVILMRVLWVMSINVIARWRVRRYGFHPPRPMIPPTLAGGILISWCGMRGIVTLATALALPADFPGRDLILLVAFTVVLGTLVLQGLSLPWLLRTLTFKDDDPVARELRDARIAVYRAGMSALEGRDDPPAHALRWELEESLRVAEDTQQLVNPLDQLRQQCNEIARETAFKMRNEGIIGDAAYQALQEELDAEELTVADRTG